MTDTTTATEFRATFGNLARQLANRDFPDQWLALAQRLAETGDTITAEEAAGWANLGYLPGEAAAEMARGITLDDARYIEEQQSLRPAAHIWRDGKRLV